MIDKPGLYEMSMDAYQADPCPVPSLSSGIARTLITKTPAHAWIEHPRLNPDFMAEESTAFDLGSAAHALLLEGEDRMEVIDADDWRKKTAQEARDAARAAGRYPVLRARYNDVQRMRDAAMKAISANRDFGYTLDQGKAEQVIVWKEGDTWLRTRPDWLSHDRKRQLHYKTTEASADPSAWMKTMLGMGAEIELAMYARGARSIGAPSDALSVFLVQENYAPFACSFVGFTPEFWDFADAKMTEATETWAECLLTDCWPGYTNRIAYLIPPAWALSQYEERTIERGLPQDGEAYGRAFGIKEGEKWGS